MKTQIKKITDSRVSVKYQDLITDDIREFELYAPANGGYVRFDNGNQVCEKLSTRGNTLTWSGSKPLVNLIRAEYKKMYAADKKQLQN